MDIPPPDLDSAQESAWRALDDHAAPDVYLWGPPGRGKTWLVDRYLASTPPRRLLRTHFHEFFADVHAEIRSRGSLSTALDAVLTGLDTVCFDEFHVHDPADGRFLAALLVRARERGIRLIMTSNYPPIDLMPNPLFHSMFEPTIEMIHRHVRVVECDAGIDYRQARPGVVRGIWLSPGDDAQFENLGLRPPDLTERTTVRPAGHPIVADRAEGTDRTGRTDGTEGTHDGEIWFRFAELCGKPTAAVDYLPLARTHRRWVITDVPARLDAEPAQRFVTLIDVLWEKAVEVIVSAAVPPGALDADCAAHDLGRMISRLGELSTLPSGAG